MVCLEILWGMEKPPLLLTRRDPRRNMARFYLLAIAPTLFDGAALTRNWGRIGTKGRTRVDLFETLTQAEQRFQSLARSKTLRGYQARL
jgi:predicted DNA-binding WGR domain protein